MTNCSVFSYSFINVKISNDIINKCVDFRLYLDYGIYIPLIKFSKLPMYMHHLLLSLSLFFFWLENVYASSCSARQLESSKMRFAKNEKGSWYPFKSKCFN